MHRHALLHPSSPIFRTNSKATIHPSAKIEDCIFPFFGQGVTIRENVRLNECVVGGNVNNGDTTIEQGVWARRCRLGEVDLACVDSRTAGSIPTRLLDCSLDGTALSGVIAQGLDVSGGPTTVSLSRSLLISTDGHPITIEPVTSDPYRIEGVYYVGPGFQATRPEELNVQAYSNSNLLSSEGTIQPHLEALQSLLEAVAAPLLPPTVAPVRPPSLLSCARAAECMTALIHTSPSCRIFRQELGLT